VSTLADPRDILDEATGESCLPGRCDADATNRTEFFHRGERLIGWHPWIRQIGATEGLGYGRVTGLRFYTAAIEVARNP
jgi:hypothetical protein